MLEGFIYIQGNKKMKNKMLKVLMIGGIFLGISIAFAGREVFKELRNELANYKKEHILPQLNEWKLKIDSELSSEDLAELNRIREEASDLMVRAKNERMNRLESGERPDKNEVRNIREVQKKNRKEIASKLTPIIEKYPDLVNDLKDEVESKHEKWAEDIKDIHVNWKNENSDELDEMKSSIKNGKGKKGKNGRKGRSETSFHDDDMMMPKGNNKVIMGRVFLFNGEDFFNEPSFNPFNETIEKPSSPNPFSSNTTIKLDLKKSGNVLVTVLNSSGTKVETLFNGNLNKGEHEFNLDGSKFPAGTYIYKIESPDGIQTGKMIKK